MEETKVLNENEIINEGGVYPEEYAQYVNNKKQIAPIFISVVFISAIIAFFIVAGLLIVTQILARDIGSDLVVVGKLIFILIASVILAGSIALMEKNLLDSDEIYRLQLKISGLISIACIIVISLIQYFFDKVGYDVARSSELIISGLFIAFIALLTCSGKYVME